MNLRTLVLFGAMGGLLHCGGTDGEEGEPVGQGTEQALLAGPKVTEQETAAHLRKAGFSEDVIPQMVCVAKWESSFYTRAYHRNANGSSDYGLFQVNGRYWAAACKVTAQELYDPAINAECALMVYASGGLNQWYGYKNHHKECASYHLAE